MSRRRAARVASATVGMLAATAALPVLEVLWARRARAVRHPEHVLDGTVGTGATPLRICWLGDSLAAGVGASTAAGSLPHQVAVALGVPVGLRVLARPGARVDDVIAAQVPALERLDEAPDVVVVNVGANDVAHLGTLREFRAGYQTLLDRLAGRRVVVLGLPDMGNALVLAQPLRALAGAQARRFDRALQRLVTDQPGITHVDVAGGCGPIARELVVAHLSPDRYHPNEHGYRLWAQVVAAALTGPTSDTAGAGLAAA